MTTPELHLLLPCPKCHARTGEPCLPLKSKEPPKRPHVRRTPVAPCGTSGGYQRHRKAGEEPCDSCRDANRRYMSGYRDKNPDKRNQDVRLLRARREAIKLLIAAHRDEFAQLMSGATVAD